MERSDAAEMTLPAKRARSHFEQISHGRIEKACGERDSHADGVGASEPVRRGVIALGSFGENGRINIHAGLRHAGGDEDVLAKEAGIRHPGDMLDDFAEKNVIRVAVVELRAWFKVQGLVLNKGDAFLGGVVLALVGVEAWSAGKVRDAGSMRQKIVNGHLSPCVWNVRKVGLDGLIHVELPAFLQQQNGGGGELLGERSDAELRVDGIWNGPLKIGVAVASFQNDVVALCDQYVAHEAFVIHIILDHLDHALFVERRALRDGDGRKAENHSEEYEAWAQGQIRSPPTRYATDTKGEAPEFLTSLEL